MKYSGLIRNDTASGPGVCVSFYTQGCELRCEGCHNPQTWDKNGGKEFTSKTLKDILDSLRANGVQRNFAILGGEPFSPYNRFLVRLILEEVRKHYPRIQVWVWTGYTMEQLITETQIEAPNLIQSLGMIDVLVTGPYIQEERDITLPHRGSRNQQIFIFDKQKNFWYNKERIEEVYRI